MKKILALVLAAMMLLSLVACMGDTTTSQTPGSSNPKSETPASEGTTGGDVEQSEEPAKSLEPLNSTDEITLSYAVWDDYEMAELLAASFHEKYPNITIEINRLPLDGYTDALAALAANGEMPDVYQFLSMSAPINNGWFYDFTEYWDNDPDVDNYLDSLHGATKIDGERAFRICAEYLPCVVFLDRNVFAKLNVDMPDYNWTYQQMMQLIPELTRPDQGIFGYNYFIGPITYAPIVLNDALSEFGWDGSEYHLEGAWADALNTVADYRRLGYQALQGSDAWGAVSGDVNMWPGNSGMVAMQLDAWWTLNNIYTKSEAIDLGIDMVPYVVPRGENTSTNRKPAFLDFCALSASTQYPREAYEFMKYVSFDSDGWMTRIDGFKTLMDEAGNKIYDLPNCLPLTNDQAVWDAFRALYPSDPAYDAFFDQSREPVPLGGQGILGFDDWLGEIYQNGEYNGVINIEAAVFEGAVNANDAAAELNTKGKEYYENMLNTLYSVYGRP